MLPPVIDLEFYGDKETNTPKREDVEEQLKTMLILLEAHYNQKPIIYATEKSYAMYLSNDYKEYDIWIRNVISKPELSDDRAWTFWQYTNRERLAGYNGKEQYIDVNVFCGNHEEYYAYLESNAYQTSG
jgi:lysozyme